MSEDDDESYVEQPSPPKGAGKKLSPKPKAKASPAKKGKLELQSLLQLEKTSNAKKKKPGKKDAAIAEWNDDVHVSHASVAKDKKQPSGTKNPKHKGNDNNEDDYEEDDSGKDEDAEGQGGDEESEEGGEESEEGGDEEGEDEEGPKMPSPKVGGKSPKTSEDTPIPPNSLFMSGEHKHTYAIDDKHPTKCVYSNLSQDRSICNLFSANVDQIVKLQDCTSTHTSWQSSSNRTQYFACGCQASGGRVLGRVE